jgi:hypothetical protein
MKMRAEYRKILLEMGCGLYLPCQCPAHVSGFLPFPQVLRNAHEPLCGVVILEFRLAVPATIASRPGRSRHFLRVLYDESCASSL